MSNVKIKVLPHGPYVVEGNFELSDAEGNTWDITGKPAVGLCRCGHSANRPFCDGSHKAMGFVCAVTPVAK